MAEINRAIGRAEMLERWAYYTSDRLQYSIAKKKIGVTGSLNYSIMYQMVGGLDVSSIIHSFNYYGKMVDMGVGRGQKLEDVKGNADLINGRHRRPKKWFSKSYFAEITSLRELLAEKYGEDAANIIKEAIEKNT